MLVRQFGLPLGRLAASRWLSTVPSKESVIDDRFDSLLTDVYADVPSHQMSSGHDVMVLHPKIRWGDSSPSALKDPQYQLDEAVALVNTLPGFRVVDSAVVGVDYSTKRKTIWGSGRIEALMRRKHEQRVSALMVNVEMLTPQQQNELHKIFRVPVFDRYNIVLSIFKQYAATEEARLQIQLAELPYIKHRLHFLNRAPSKASILQVDAVDQRANADQFELLHLREQSIRKKLAELLTAGKSEATRESHDGAAAMVAVVGYTNAGKTSLVKRLTGAETLQPKDRLFATLDTSRHTARLPSGRRAVFTDTIGFLSDLPTHLIAAFEATLAHVKMADVIVHLRDVSNPAWRAQSEDVEGTLDLLGLTQPQLDDVIIVDNKIDKGEAVPSDDSSFRISCSTGEGVEELVAAIDLRVMKATGCRPRRLRLKPSSPIIPYLYREGLVVREPSPAPADVPSSSSAPSDLLIFDVVMTDAEMTRMQKHVGGAGLQKRTTIQ